MGNYTERFTEGHRLTVLHPVSRTADTFDSDWVSMRDYHRAVAILDVGAIGAATTVDLSIRQAKDTSGGSAKAITGKAITQLDASDDNKIVAIELQTEELDVDAGFDCISARLVVAGGNAALSQVTLLRIQPRFAPVGTDEFDEVIT